MKKSLIVSVVLALSVLVPVAYCATYVVENDGMSVSEIAKKVGIQEYFIYQMNPALKGPKAKAGQEITYVSQGDMLYALAFNKRAAMNLEKLGRTGTRDYATLKKEINELSRERICYYPFVDDEDNYEGIHWRTVLRQVEAFHKSQLAKKKT